MRKHAFIAVVLIAVLATGCATTKSTLQSWVGSNESDVVAAWGAPTASIETQDGGRTLTWETKSGTFGQNLCRKSLTADESGKIVAWSYQGCVL